MANVQHFALTAGEDRTLSLVARDAANAILNLTSATLTFRLSAVQGQTNEISKTGSIVSAAAGTYTVTLTDGDTDDLDEGDYVYQVTATISGTTTLCTKGKIRVEALNQ